MTWLFSNKKKKNAGLGDHTKAACSGHCFHVEGVEIGMQEAGPIGAPYAWPEFGSFRPVLGR